MRSLQYANGLTETVDINQQRQQILSITATKGTTQLLRLDYGYGATATANNGDLIKQTITRGADVAVEDYTYDALNRLLTAARTGATALAPYNHRYCYDRYGNRALTSGSTQPPGGTGLTPIVADTNCPVADSISNATVAAMFLGNRWTSVTHDAFNGNVVNDGWSALDYDVEGRVTKSTRTTCGTNFEEYNYYDGDGRRVRRETKSGTTVQTNTVYAYDAAGALAAEYTTVGASPVTGMRYLTTDHLGSTRLVTDSAGTEVARHDYMPFGQEWPTRPSVVDILFTGKERDAETGLDYFGARYMSAAQGRFTSPDPMVHPAESQMGQVKFMSDPQLWNRYAYTRNNPLRYVDPDGYELRVAAELQQTVTTMRQESPSFNAELAAHEGTGPNLTIKYGATANDPGGQPSIGLTNAQISIAGIEPMAAPFQDWSSGVQYGGYKGATVTINDSIKDDKGQIEGTLAHEIGHVNDARTNTNNYGKQGQREHTSGAVVTEWIEFFGDKWPGVGGSYVRRRNIRRTRRRDTWNWRGSGPSSEPGGSPDRQRSKQCSRRRRFSGCLSSRRPPINGPRGLSRRRRRNSRSRRSKERRQASSSICPTAQRSGGTQIILISGRKHLREARAGLFKAAVEKQLEITAAISGAKGQLDSSLGAWYSDTMFKLLYSLSNPAPKEPNDPGTFLPCRDGERREGCPE